MSIFEFLVGWLKTLPEKDLIDSIRLIRVLELIFDFLDIEVSEEGVDASHVERGFHQSFCSSEEITKKTHFIYSLNNV